MTTIQKQWQVAPRLTAEADEQLNQYSPIFRQILFNRGIATTQAAETFITTRPELGDPYQLTGMAGAVERIGQALENQEQVVVYGDYDADGITSSALLVQALTALGAQVHCYIPDRFKEGYGLNIAALDKIKADGAALVITVDCGIRAVPQAEHARQIGLDLIITDHHTPGADLPEVVALINPKQPDDAYPEKNLAGVGVAFKLASALLNRFPAPKLTPEHLLDLVAIGTVADMVPLVGENRTLVRKGLNTMRRPHRQGLLSLMGVANIKAESIVAMNIGFSIGPRLNAAGRIASALEAYDLLLATDVAKAGQMAQTLDNHNRERQSITREIQEKSEELATAESADSYLLFAAHPDFNAGVVGLAASRLSDKYYRPAVVGHRGPDVTRASCRSIAEFHITHALEECADLLDHFGGHAAAAGFTVKNARLDELIERLTSIAHQQLSGSTLRPTLQTDLEVQLVDLKPSLLEELDLLEPIGYGNREAVFVSRGVWVRNKRAVGRDQSHLKLTLSDGRMTFDAIAFRQGHWLHNMPERIDVAYTFEVNEFNGRKSLQLNIKDIQAPQ